MAGLAGMAGMVGLVGMAGKMASYIDSEAFLQKPGNCSPLLYPTSQFRPTLSIRI
jgi:hypothetical protein